MRISEETEAKFQDKWSRYEAKKNYPITNKEEQNKRIMSPFKVKSKGAEESLWQQQNPLPVKN
jgi:hypothetical protein